MTHQNAQPALHFIWLEVSDLARSREFYGETLGFAVEETEGEFLVVMLAGTLLYLAPGYPTPGNMYLAVAVPDKTTCPALPSVPSPSMALVGT